MTKPPPPPPHPVASSQVSDYVAWVYPTEMPNLPIQLKAHSSHSDTESQKQWAGGGGRPDKMHSEGRAAFTLHLESPVKSQILDPRTAQHPLPASNRWWVPVQSQAQQYFWPRIPQSLTASFPCLIPDWAFVPPSFPALLPWAEGDYTPSGGPGQAWFTLVVLAWLLTASPLRSLSVPV